MKIYFVILLCVLLCISCQQQVPTNFDFLPISPTDQTEDPATDRLCEESAMNPDEVQERVSLNCRIDAGDFSQEDPGGTASGASDVVVWAYNIERGSNWKEQLEAMTSDPLYPRPDILLLSEVDRGCARTGQTNIAREFAKALGMSFVYGVEFLELSANCEHGNAILSKFPLGNVKVKRFNQDSDFYVYGVGKGDEKRFGGRMYISADVKIGNKYIHLYSTHLASRFFEDTFIRLSQAKELAQEAGKQPFGVVVGGDMNTAAYRFAGAFPLPYDGVVDSFLYRGFRDAHEELERQVRYTNYYDDDVKLLIDFIFVKNVSSKDPGLCALERCKDLSDHAAIWTTIDLESAPAISPSYSAPGM